MIYLDNAATSVRPRAVIDKWTYMSSQCNANIHRAVYGLAIESTTEYESARDAVRGFIGAGSREEIIFTSGTTESINLLAFSFGEAYVREGDEIVVTEAEHHSNIVPWQMMCARKGASIKVLGVDERGRLRLPELESLLTPRTRLVCVAQISNVLGIKNPLKEIVNICHSKGCPVFVDGAQGIVHERVNVTESDCDFYAFSGHKMYAAPGTGVLYGKKRFLEEMPPYMGGGEMIESVSFSGTSYAPLPMKFEAGTRNFAGVPSFKPAIEWMSDKYDSDREIVTYMTEALKSDGRITLYGDPEDLADKAPLFSFTVKGAHHEDLALILDKMGIAVRSGQMCAEPLMDRYGVSGMVRASFGPENTPEEAAEFMKCLDRAIKMLV